MTKRIERRGRPRKFKLGEVVSKPVVQTEDLYVVVDHQLRGTKSEYRVAPLNNRFERYGRAVWTPSNEIFETGMRSYKGSIVTYRANAHLDSELGGRGCHCECCAHAAMPRDAFNHLTGEFRDYDEQA